MGYDNRTLIARRNRLFLGLGESGVVDSNGNPVDFSGDVGGTWTQADETISVAAGGAATPGAVTDSGGLSDSDKALLAGLGGALLKGGAQVASAALPSILARTAAGGFLTGVPARPAPQPSMFAGLAKVAPYAITAGALYLGWEFLLKPVLAKKRGR